MTALGIDVGKADFHAALLQDEKVARHSFPNSLVGFGRLLKWLVNRDAEDVHACMESTGGWSESLAEFLHDNKFKVSVVNPSAIKAFGNSRLSRTKTDKADAELIARYCVAMNPALWSPPAPAQRRLRELVRRRAALVEMLGQEQNRLESPGVGAAAASIRAVIKTLERQIAKIDKAIDATTGGDADLRRQRELLESIPGIGARTSTAFLAEIPRIEEFRTRKAVAAFAGLCPRERRSGSSVSASWLSRMGSPLLRKAFYMPALVAMRYNPLIKAWSEQLRARAKRPKQVIAAVMRRLITLAFGVLRSGRPFDPGYHLLTAADRI